MEAVKEFINNNKKLLSIIAIIIALGVITTLIFILIRVYIEESFSISPNSYLLPDRVPSNPLSYVVYPFRQLLNWDDLPTGAREMTTKQGTGKV